MNLLKPYPYLILDYDNGYASKTEEFDIEAEDEGRERYISFEASVSFEYRDRKGDWYLPPARTTSNLQITISNIKIRNEFGDPVKFNYQEIESLIKKYLSYE